MFWRIKALFFIKKILREIGHINNEGCFGIKFSNNDIPNYLVADERVFNIRINSYKRLWVRKRIQESIQNSNVWFGVSLFGSVDLFIEINT